MKCLMRQANLGKEGVLDAASEPEERREAGMLDAASEPGKGGGA